MGDHNHSNKHNNSTSFVPQWLQSKDSADKQQQHMTDNHPERKSNLSPEATATAALSNSQSSPPPLNNNQTGIPKLNRSKSSPHIEQLLQQQQQLQSQQHSSSSSQTKHNNTIIPSSLISGGTSTATSTTSISTSTSSPVLQSNGTGPSHRSSNGTVTSINGINLNSINNNNNFILNNNSSFTKYKTKPPLSTFKSQPNLNNFIEQTQLPSQQQLQPQPQQPTSSSTSSSSNNNITVSGKATPQQRFTQSISPSSHLTSADTHYPSSQDTSNHYLVNGGLISNQAQQLQSQSQSLQQQQSFVNNEHNMDDNLDNQDQFPPLVLKSPKITFNNNNNINVRSTSPTFNANSPVPLLSPPSAQPMASSASSSSSLSGVTMATVVPLSAGPTLASLITTTATQQQLQQHQPTTSTSPLSASTEDSISKEKAKIIIPNIASSSSTGNKLSTTHKSSIMSNPNSLLAGAKIVKAGGGQAGTLGSTTQPKSTVRSIQNGTNPKFIRAYSEPNLQSSLPTSTNGNKDDVISVSRKQLTDPSRKLKTPKINKIISKNSFYEKIQQTELDDKTKAQQQQLQLEEQQQQQQQQQLDASAQTKNVANMVPSADSPTLTKHSLSTGSTTPLSNPTQTNEGGSTRSSSLNSPMYQLDHPCNTSVNSNGDDEEDVEHEERFLRGLGWVPAEEDSLSDTEIEEISMKMKEIKAIPL
ncbi:hypothetical protein SAMD00019534_077170 [Acytostelium subglobosum LB1]|uniref:hypothetical protein n=1 Tax=Acytostelium subglobosum LB1 TaxID=1410327 RepID=UPI000644F6B3|nr:hypothetical protein SAMD00019534_077170 [Acytostelium subglobosum LB1]GAM24542.1 hypothetical protein SAMD00019534_077170 [Acytostelium subglobosum LB1]|eukprot:XP_012752868.1 hypothetical protein SAMD00019534_077170 [Acytostelium subglobosum LB1]